VATSEESVTTERETTTQWPTTTKATTTEATTHDYDDGPATDDDHNGSATPAYHCGAPTCPAAPHVERHVR
jgi:hypothetical protein